jgi:hypothetical protein
MCSVLETMLTLCVSSLYMLPLWEDKENITFCEKNKVKRTKQDYNSHEVKLNLIRQKGPHLYQAKMATFVSGPLVINQKDHRFNRPKGKDKEKIKKINYILLLILLKEQNKTIILIKWISYQGKIHYIRPKGPSLYQTKKATYVSSQNSIHSVRLKETFF